jgi:hypothetical protein
MSEQKLSDKLRLCQQAAGTIDWDWLIKQVASLEWQLEQVSYNRDAVFDSEVECEREIKEAIEHLKTAINRLNQ